MPCEGVKIFKSSAGDLWVVMMVMNELPPGMRFKEDNMLMLGAWYGPKKPDFHIFVNPIAQQFRALEDEGLDVQLSNGEQRHIRVQLLTLTADNQAKDMIINQQPNSCGNCEQPSKKEKKKKKEKRKKEKKKEKRKKKKGKKKKEKRKNN